MLKTLLFVFAFSSFAHAQYVGFAKGNQLSATPVQGRVHVVCNGFNGTGAALYSCHDVVLDPAAYDHFIGPKDSRADGVILVVKHEDGSVRDRASSYDGVRGKSRDAFNLWISTLFQKPILEAGVNTVQYRIFSGKILLAEGRFQAIVTRGGARTCPNAQYNSTDNNDCNSQYSICQRYFEEYNNCHP
ncbi:hypothetical protein ACES2L_15450 [Bdellovibrio bacteriovorus]